MNHESLNPHSRSEAAATFFGGMTFTVTHEDGSTESVKVRQLPMRHYETAYQLIRDEIALTAFCCERSTDKGPLIADKPWALTLQPESYEQLQDAARKVNEKGFFSYARRRNESERAEKQETLEMMAGIDPATLRSLAELGASRSTVPSPQRPRPWG